MPKLPALAIALVLAVGGIFPAKAQSVRTILSSYALLGTWSRDCQQPAAADNERVIFAAPATGYGSLRYEFGAARAPLRFDIRRATDLSSDRVLVHEYGPDDNSMLDTVFQKADGKIRIFWSRESDSGNVLVDTGIAASTGAAEDWLSPCK